MDRRRWLKLLGSVPFAATSGCSERRPDETAAPGTDDPTETEMTDTNTPPAGQYRNPVYEPVMADPTVVRDDDGTFYAYGTETDYREDRDPVLVPILRSTDLVDWTFVGGAFESRPDWKDEGGFWAPDAVRYDGTYYLFYAYSTWGDENPGIGVATADDPEGPFDDHGELLRSDSIGVENSIDPAFVLDAGTPYLFWGSFNGIHGIELTGDATGHVGADEKFQVAGDRFEAPFLFGRDGAYYLFLSAGTCCEGPWSTYHVVVGRANELEGPYRDADGRSLLDDAGTLAVEGGNGFVGPGHNCVIGDEEGTDWMLYHAYEEGKPYVDDDPSGELRRTLMLDPLQWTEERYPIVEDRVPSDLAETPTIGRSD